MQTRPRKREVLRYERRVSAKIARDKNQDTKRTKQQTGRLVTARGKLYKMGLVVWTLHYFSGGVATFER